MIPEAEDQSEETGSINYPDIKNETWWSIKAKYKKIKTHL